MRPLALAFLILLSGCAAGTRTPPSSAPAIVAGNSPWVFFPRANKPSPLMEAALTLLREQHAFAALDTWTRLPELPAWASLKSLKSDECEIAVPSGVSMAMDAFNYMVIVGKDRKTIVIRSGGFAGVYQIFEEKEPDKAPGPTPTSIMTPAGTGGAPAGVVAVFDFGQKPYASNR